MARFGKRREREAAGFGGGADDEGSEVGLLAPEPSPDVGSTGGSRLTPVQVQEKVFRLAFRGYSEREVDEFLDLVTEELAALREENKRLREEVELRGGSGGDDARRHAEETVRRAREEAARIISEAEAAAGGGTVAALPGTSAAFLTRERDFLQELARLVQDHADALRAEAARARRPPPQAPPQSPGDPGGAARGGPAPPTNASPAAGRSGAGPEEPSRAPSSAGDLQDEPSLRELFWGEE